MARRLGGTFFPKLDEKGRLTLPAKYREHFADGVVVTRVQEGCLAVYDVETFDSLDARFESRATSDGRSSPRSWTRCSPPSRIRGEDEEGKAPRLPASIR